jgi:hypothetical protein
VTGSRGYDLDVIDHFIDYILNDEEPAMPVEIGRDVVEAERDAKLTRVGGALWL